MSSIAARAADEFSGTWVIDLRSVAERRNKVECGNASFKLTQTGERVIGDHTFFTPGCGRLNEGGENTVKGIVVGHTAILAVTSGRNGAVVLGKATVKNGTLHWATLDEIKAGEPATDSALILGSGVLKREAQKR